jgi:energy-converting hydrogenase Eha subunit B
MPDGAGRFTVSDGVSLKEHLEQQISSLDARLQKELGAVEKATMLAADALGRRLDDMGLDIRTVRTFMNESKGMASQKAVSQATLLAVVGVLLGLAGLVASLIK